MAVMTSVFADNSYLSPSKIDGDMIEMATISRAAFRGLEPAEESRSANYAFIKGPEELNGRRVDQPDTQKIILEWLESERSKGRKLVGAFDTSLTWLFEITPNSVRFIKDEF